MNWELPKVYAVKHKNENVRASSRSGGIFTALSDFVLENKGVIYGCVLDDNFNALHIRAEDENTRNRMRGSKYIQSKLGDTYKNVKDDLQNSRSVLFSGTSCQVAGLKNYLGKEYENLLCVDIVCHGVPSPKVWDEFLLWQEKKNNSRIMEVDFRNKKDFGWADHKEKLLFENGKTVNSTVFKTLFFGHNILRPCCHECPYKSVMHPGDITIADYWGIDKAAPEYNDNKGVSLVLINNEKGNSVFESVKANIKWKETKLEDSMQPALKAPSPISKNRKEFWSDFSNHNFEYIAKKYGGLSLKFKLKRKLRGWKSKAKKLIMKSKK